MSHISFKRVLQQLKADLIGKDSHRGVTLTYSWMANQFGHFSLGFIPSFLVFHFSTLSVLRSSFYVAIFWTFFELYNFLGPLIKNRNKQVFSPEWLNIALDTFTDLCFFWLGSLTFSLLMEYTPKLLLFEILLFLIVFYPSRYWFLTKMYQSYARYPFQFRLSQWFFEISERDKEKVANFMKVETKDNHLFIFGSQKTGKTSLGIGIVNELSIQQKTCLYTSAIKLYASFLEDDITSEDSRLIWTWKEAEFLVIDDINSGGPIEDLVDPEKFLCFIDASPERNRNFIKNKNIIWILGNKSTNEFIVQNAWISMLKTVGVESEKITSVNLLKKEK